MELQPSSASHKDPVVAETSTDNVPQIQYSCGGGQSIKQANGKGSPRLAPLLNPAMSTNSGSYLHTERLLLSIHGAQNPQQQLQA